MYTNLSNLAKNSNEIYEYASLDNMITGCYRSKEPYSFLQTRDYRKRQLSYLIPCGASVPFIDVSQMNTWLL